jgi:hypothetical protein
MRPFRPAPAPNEAPGSRLALREAIRTIRDPQRRRPVMAGWHACGNRRSIRPVFNCSRHRERPGSEACRQACGPSGPSRERAQAAPPASPLHLPRQPLQRCHRSAGDGVDWRSRCSEREAAAVPENFCSSETWIERRSVEISGAPVRRMCASALNDPNTRGHCREEDSFRPRPLLGGFRFLLDAVAPRLRCLQTARRYAGAAIGWQAGRRDCERRGLLSAPPATSPGRTAS